MVINARYNPMMAPPLPEARPGGALVADDPVLREHAPDLVFGLGDLPAAAVLGALGKSRPELTAMTPSARAALVTDVMTSPGGASVLAVQLGAAGGHTGTPMSSVSPVSERLFRMRYADPEANLRGRKSLDAKVSEVGSFGHRAKRLVEELGDHRLSEVLAQAYRATRGEIGTVSQIARLPAERRHALIETLVTSLRQEKPAVGAAALGATGLVTTGAPLSSRTALAPRRETQRRTVDTSSRPAALPTLSASVGASFSPVMRVAVSPEAITYGAPLHSSVGLVGPVGAGAPLPTREVVAEGLEVGSKQSPAPAAVEASTRGGFWGRAKRLIGNAAAVAVMGAALVVPTGLGTGTPDVTPASGPAVQTQVEAPRAPSPDPVGVLAPSTFVAPEPAAAPSPLAAPSIDRAPAVDSSARVEHEVVRRDTMWDIARELGISFNQLWRMNPSQTNPDLIFPGDRLVTSGPQSTPKYAVQDGDTAGAIAQRFGVSLDALEKENPGYDRAQTIRPGQLLAIPVS